MNSTSESLLLRLRHAQDHAAWSTFVRLYTPLIFYWARKTGLQASDAADLVQEVLTIVFQKLPEFQYDRNRSFRGWMRTITLNKFRELGRKKKIQFTDATGSMIAKVPDSVAESTWDLNYQQALVTQAMQLLASEFRPQTWRALQEYMILQRPAKEVANEFDMSVWTIYAAKSRLMTRLREQIDELLD
ncbi:MAG: sigma-70 family RNA polymerase sigma factor [Planctomycetota bacterium]